MKQINNVGSGWFSRAIDHRGLAAEPLRGVSRTLRTSFEQHAAGHRSILRSENRRSNRSIKEGTTVPSRSPLLALRHNFSKNGPVAVPSRWFWGQMSKQFPPIVPPRGASNHPPRAPAERQAARPRGPRSVNPAVKLSVEARPSMHPRYYLAPAGPGPRPRQIKRQSQPDLASSQASNLACAYCGLCIYGRSRSRGCWASPCTLHCEVHRILLTARGGFRGRSRGPRGTGPGV